METEKRKNTGKIILLVTMIVLLILVGSLTAWYWVSVKNQDTQESYLVPESQQTQSTQSVSSSVDGAVKEIDSETKAVDESDFNENELNDSTLGL